MKYAQCDYWLVDKTHQCTFKDCETKIEWARDSDHYPLFAKIQLNKKRERKKNTIKKGRQNTGNLNKNNGKSTIAESGKYFSNNTRENGMMYNNATRKRYLTHHSLWT